MVKNPSRFSGATGLRQNIVRNNAAKLPPLAKDYADPSVQPSQAFYEADGSVVPGQSNMDGIPPNQQPGYEDDIKTAEDMGQRDLDYTTNEIDDQKRGGLYGWHQDNQNKEDTYQGVEGFHWLANVFQSDPNKKFIVNPDKSDGSPKFVTTGAAAVLQADIKAKEALAADALLADQLAVSNSAHTGGYDSFYIGGSSVVNPNQVKFDKLRKDILTKDNKATGVMQEVDGKNVFQPWTQVAQNYGPNVNVNYGLYGDPMNPKPGEGPSGTMTINRSMSEQSHAGIQTAINKQQMNRDFNLTLKTWQSEYLLGPRDESSKVKAKAFIDAQKAKYLGYEDRGGHGFGGYGEMFGKELDKRYTNLFNSPSSPGMQKTERKLTMAEKLKIKINNGTATQAEQKKYATLTQTPGNLSGYSNTTSGKVKTNDAITGYTDFMGGNQLY